MKRAGSIIKNLLLIALYFQFSILLITSPLLKIPMITILNGVIVFTIVLGMGTDLVELLKKLSYGTLFFMNTTLTMWCINNKDGIYNTLIRDSINKLSDEYVKTK